MLLLLLSYNPLSQILYSLSITILFSSHSPPDTNNRLCTFIDVVDTYLFTRFVYCVDCRFSRLLQRVYSTYYDTSYNTHTQVYNNICFLFLINGNDTILIKISFMKINFIICHDIRIWCIYRFRPKPERNLMISCALCVLRTYITPIPHWASNWETNFNFVRLLHCVVFNRNIYPENFLLYVRNIVYYNIVFAL